MTTSRIALPRLEGDAVGDGLLMVETDHFQGPLDLLLHLIRTQDVDIFDIPIAPIAQQFLKAVESVVARRIDEAGEFLEMAATLVRIKAKLLLPRSPDDEGDEDPRAELVRRLLEHEQVREIAQRFRAAEDDRRRRFSKGYVPARPKLRPTDLPLDVDWDDVFAAALGVEPPDEQDAEHRIRRRPVAMRAKAKLIVETLRRVRRIEFRNLVTPWKRRAHGVMTLLAGLELGKRQIVSLRQRRPFSPLWMYPGQQIDQKGLDALSDVGGEDEEPTAEESAAPLFAQVDPAGGAAAVAAPAGGSG